MFATIIMGGADFKIYYFDIFYYFTYYETASRVSMLIARGPF